MSILDRGPHVVVVYPVVGGVDSRGNPVRKPSDVGVLVRGMMQPRQSDIDNQTNRIEVEYDFITRDAPIEEFARVEYAGMAFACIGVEKYGTSEKTAHVTARLRQIR